MSTIAAVAVLAATILAGTSLLVLGERGRREVTPAVTASPTPRMTDRPGPPMALPLAPGTLTGSAAYPAGTAPPDLEVCAEAVGRPFTACTKAEQQKGSLYGLGYRLTVPGGTYRVYSVSRSTDPKYRGYYTAGARCERRLAYRPGYEASQCSDRSILDVPVMNGQIVPRVDAVDYYGPFKG
ncbi:MAG: hypothetical protein M3N59_02700 [bacterium]|nr:hypothetical protein [bacterium]